MTTLNQYKTILRTEMLEIESLIERRKASPEHMQRLKEIEEQFKTIELMENPDSIFKKILNQK